MERLRRRIDDGSIGGRASAEVVWLVNYVMWMRDALDRTLSFAKATERVLASARILVLSKEQDRVGATEALRKAVTEADSCRNKARKTRPMEDNDA